MNLEQMKQKVNEMQKKIKVQESKSEFVTLEFRDARGKKIRAFRHLKKDEAFKLQRDLYKLLVTSMKQKISMSQIPETKKRA